MNYVYVPYVGYIVAKGDHFIGLGQKRYGGVESVEHNIPLPYVGHVVYSSGGQGDGVKSADLFINKLIRQIELPDWLAKEKGLV